MISRKVSWIGGVCGILLFALLGCGGGEPATRTRDSVVIDALTSMIEFELNDKGIPGLSIALVDGDKLIWAEGFGMADAANGVAATPETIYRVGSVSKLFTDLAAMQLVERGELDLDVPVREYLPDFHPQNPYDKQITLRQLMSHRSGLVREPPVGNYFDPTSPTLEATVASLNATRLVYEPESRAKYSNAGVSVVGRVLEQVKGEPFADYVKRAVLEPMGLDDSAFQPSDAIRSRLAHAVMWSYDGRSFPAPTFELGMAPAGSMYTTVLDLAKFLGVLFANGRAPEGPVIRPGTLHSMFKPQYAEPDAKFGYGIGFGIRDLDGHTLYGHGGAIYGFSTSLAFLHEEQLGVVVVANMDVVNSVTGRIAEQALKLMLADRDGRTLSPKLPTEPLGVKLAKHLEGRYVGDGTTVDLVERNGELFAYIGTKYVRVRSRGSDLLLDDRTDYGPVIEITDDGSLRIEETTLARTEPPKPAPPADAFVGLIGEYGWDHNTLFIYERDGRLHALIEWTEIDPLTQISRDLFAFPEVGGMYHGEHLIFDRDRKGRATAVIVAGIRFARRAIQGEQAETFHIEPVRDVEELRREALAAGPPEEQGDFLPSDLVEVVALDPTIKLDIRYATTNNFMQARFYSQARAFMQRPAAEALVRVHRELEKSGFGLLVHDTYRPWYVTKMFWDATPEESKIFVADPAKGSRHNRGCAADITLYDRASGKPIEMVGLYDEMSERSYPNYQGGTSLQRWHRELLRDAMEAEGFHVYDYEWWHFDYDGWNRYRIENRVFEEIAETDPR